MNDPSAGFSQRCVIIGAAPGTNTDLLCRMILPDDYVICADGGFTAAMEAGIPVHLLIGDFDSCPQPEPSVCETMVLPVNKDDTDTLFCVREAIRRGYTDFLLLGMTGGRPDHTFANYSVLLYLANRGLHGCIRDEQAQYEVLLNQEARLLQKAGFGFGIFPFGCPECNVSLHGFLYEADRLTLRAEFPMGVSNTVLLDDARIVVHSGSALWMLYGFQDCS